MRWIMGFATCLIMVALFGAAQNSPIQPGEDRWLSGFTNDDGSRPDGNPSDRDDSSALQKALNAGAGVVRIGPGTFRLHDVTIPTGVALIGSGTATVLQASQNRPVFLQQQVAQWRLRDVVLQGEATGPWHERTDQSAHGLVITGSWGYDVSGVTMRNFHGAGIQISFTNNQASGFCDGGRLAQITAYGNFIGVRFDTRAEYITTTQLHCRHNVIGVVIHAGNSSLASCNIGENIDGIVIEDHENGSHGSLTGCLVNHNQRHALWAKNAENGMAITNCCFFYGTIKLENSRGVTISAGLISCNIATDGADANRIAGNHVIPPGFTFQFAPSTQIADNYTKAGDWEHNRP